MYYFLISLFKRIFIGSPETPHISIVKPIDPPEGTGSPYPFEKSKEYELIATTKAEPCMIPKTPDFPIRPYLGSTTYLFRDKDTGEFKEVTIPGLEETSLFNILKTVDEQGTVRFERDGKIYLFGKLEEEQKIPVR